VRHLLQAGRTDTPHPIEFFHGPETTVLPAVIDDAPGEVRPDAW
jgi:hypothetical protein